MSNSQAKNKRFDFTVESPAGRPDAGAAPAFVSIQRPPVETKNITP